MAAEIKIKGIDFLDTQKRKQALNKVNTLTTEELVMLEQFCTPKGIQAFKENFEALKTLA